MLQKLSQKIKGEKNIDFKYNLKLYFGILKNYKKIFFAVLFVIFIMEFIDIADKFLFKIIIDKGAEFTGGSITAEALIKILLTVAAVYLSFALINMISRYVHIYLLNRMESGLVADLKQKFFNHIIHLDYNFHTTNKTGSLISRLIRGAGAIERLTDVIIFNFAPLTFQLTVAAASLFYFSKIPALIAVLTIIVLIVYSFIIQRMQERANIILNQTEDREKANISDFFTNIDSIKYFGQENIIKSRFKKVSQQVKIAMVKHWDYYNWMDAGRALILSVGTLLLIYFPLVDFLQGKTTLGSVVFIYTVFGSLIGPMFGFVRGLRDYYRSMADFEVLFQHYKVDNVIKDQPGAKDLKIQKGEIEFKNVSFNYQKRKLFKDFNLKIPEAKKVALVGHSGSGKTTLVRLLYRFYDLGLGQILIDGKDIAEFKQESLRNEMSIVPQECVLFDDTIYNNIAFSNPKAERKQVLAAIKFAQLDKVIADFPQKEKTIVGERGVRLSGGEKQRVSIARAILADKKILVLDEATSSLDSQTEHEIQQDLEKLMQGRTSIIIAHRLSTIMGADQIIVMEKGRIIQQGKHVRLIREKGPYKHLWNLQKGGYIK
ncbi:ABC transporter ATP-binding protein/permease [Patescibacteria group bacterium]|nr:ABC transporter ATP-binding protein/permease [Patescibacteria group bacterium]